MPIPPNARGYERFEGRIGRTTADSTPSWTSPPTAPPNAPNIVVIVIDDMGYSDTGPYGSEIDTPNLDRLAASGIKFTNYHTTPLCSPSRASLLTGLNAHRAGYGYVSNADPGYPGLRLELADDVSTLPEILRDNGYATYGVGKWHLVRDANMGPGSTKDSWPTQRGFDRYYGSLEGLNSFFHPNQLTSDNGAVEVDQYPPDYYLTDDLTDRAVGYIKDLRAHSSKPFFLYFAHVAMHGPLQVKPTDRAKYTGSYSEGWDKLRESRFARQIVLGLFPEGTRQAQRNTEPGYDVQPWDDLTPAQQRRFAQYMEVYAGMVDSVDQSIGKVLDVIEELGELDNTIVVFTSDNGGTAEGGPEGTRSYFAQFAGVTDPDWVGDVPHDESLIGTAKLGVHYPRGWGQASNTPFQFYKGQTFAGGVRVPFVVSWPAGLAASNEIRDQYAYVSDLTPTLLELAGLEAPGLRNGLPVKDFDGVSFADVLLNNSKSQHYEQYSEITGHRGFYRDGWKLLALHESGRDIDDPQWQLFDVTTDPTELKDLSTLRPDKVAELAAAWDAAAWANTVFPLVTRADLARRRPEEAQLSEPVTILAGTPTLERYRSSRLIAYRDFSFTATLHSYSAADEGVLVAHGDPQGGYILYLENRKVVFGFNNFGRYAEVSGDVPTGARAITVEAVVAPKLRWNFTVTVDDVVVASLHDRVQLVAMAPWTGISVGVDSRGPVSWDLRERRGPFRYTGGLGSVTYRPGPVQVPTATVDRLESDAEAFAD